MINVANLLEEGLSYVVFIWKITLGQIFTALSILSASTFLYKKLKKKKYY